MRIVHTTKKQEAVRQRWPKTGRNTLTFANAPIFRIGAEVTFQGQLANVIDIQSNTIKLDKQIFLRSSDLSCVQPTWTMLHDEMHNLVFDAWSKYFCRDEEEVADFANVVQYLSLLETEQTMKYEPITDMQFLDAIKSTKLMSARGSDGFSTRDLQKLPKPLWTLLAKFIHSIEQKRSWPDQWLVAKTLCLTKGHTPESPLDIRPITIISKMYRLWSKIRGKQLAAYLTQQIPPSLGGPAMGISSEMIALLNADVIEDSFASDSALVGVVVDIIKAYNAIPREPLQDALLALGVHPTIVHTFAAAMKQMKRVFIIDESAGTLFSTSTGIVEGCAFAVPAMLAISMWAAKVVGGHMSNHLCLFFADNWSITNKSADELVIAFQELSKFLDALKLSISKDKSWVWALNTKNRNRLSQHSDALQGIRVCLKAKDLGVTQNYSRCRVKPLLSGKIIGSKTKCKAIGKVAVPNAFRKKMVDAAVLSRHNYGAACSLPAHNDFARLRAAVAEAIRQDKGGTNSLLVCNVHEPLDPELKDLINRIMTFKRYFHKFPDRLEPCAMRLETSTPSKHKATGPVDSLLLSLDKVNCRPTIQNCKIVIDSPYGPFCPMDFTGRTLKWLFRKLWTRACVHQIKRKDFHQIPWDFDLVASAYCQLTPRKKALVDAYTTGKRITQDKFVKFQTDNDGKCVFCHEQDTKEHRVYHCPKWTETRSKIRHLFPVLESLGPNTISMGLPSEVDVFIEEKLHAAQTVPFQLPGDAPDAHEIFVDGTAYCSEHPFLALAGAAVVEAFRDSIVANLICRARAPCIIQNSYIAEAFALVLGLNHFWVINFYSDCQTVVDQLTHIS